MRTETTSKWKLIFMTNINVLRALCVVLLSMMGMGCLPSDLDSDSITNNLDNCVLTANSDQADADKDSVGDACDDTPNSATNKGILTGSHFNGQTMEFRQPDGSKIEIKLYGDAYFMRAESPDGYTLILDDTTGWINYAQQSTSDDRLVSSGIPYSKKDLQYRTSANSTAIGLRNIPKKLQYPQRQIDEIRAKSEAGLRETDNSLVQSKQVTTAASPAVIGTINQLAILVDFPNRRSNISLSEINNAFNGASYSDKRGSIDSWSKTISNNLVSLRTQVIGYYTTKYNTSHYLRGGTFDYSAAEELKQEVFPWADARFNFATLSQKNGVVTSINILYAGDIIANGWANSIWPHAGGSSYRTNDGVTTGSYFMSNIGNSMPLDLGLFRHELGHSVFQWPDCYDYDGDSHSMGGFCMETDIPSAPFRAMHGWINVITVNNANATYKLPDNANVALRYNNPNNSKEYFLMEYMRKSGWRSGAPDEGLLIWHVDENGSNSSQEMTLQKHYRHSVEQADGLFELEKNIRGGADGDLFHAGFRTDFNDSTTPNSKWWNGATSGLKVSNIGGLGGNSIAVTIGGVTTTAPAGYTWCAGEGGSCSFTSKVDVAYGANGNFYYKSGVTGTINFNNATFGDPIPGVVKAGYYRPATGAYYFLRASHSGKFLDVSAYSTADGGNVQQWSYTGASNQQWQLQDAGNGFFYLRAKQSGKYLDVSGVYTNDGANVHQWSFTGAGNQQWSLVQVK